MKQIAMMLGLISRSFDNTAKPQRPKNGRYFSHYKAPRSMTAEEKEYYDKHKNLNKFYL